MDNECLENQLPASLYQCCRVVSWQWSSEGCSRQAPLTSSTRGQSTPLYAMKMAITGQWTVLIWVQTETELNKDFSSVIRRPQFRFLKSCLHSNKRVALAAIPRHSRTCNKGVIKTPYLRYIESTYGMGIPTNNNTSLRPTVHDCWVDPWISVIYVCIARNRKSKWNEETNNIIYVYTVQYYTWFHLWNNKKGSIALGKKMLWGKTFVDMYFLFHSP